jgi:phosphoglycerate dehydrogenase-like enzyme
MGLDVLAQAGIEVEPMERHFPEIEAEQLAGVNGVIVLTPRVTTRSLSASRDLLAIGRFGVGYDGVDVPACTAADVALFITPGAVDRPVAEATLAWMLALTHHVRIKDRLVREGKWDERSKYMGCELRDRVLGVVGLGGIGRALVQLVAGLGMKPTIAHDPLVSPQAAEALGVRLVALDELMRSADFVSIHCPLNEQTRDLIGAREIALMKPTAYLLNTARGGIVNEDALYDALKSGRIAGAALDCFVGEPISSDNRFNELDNVLLAPHSIAWTAEMFRDIGRAVCQGMVDIACGRRPRGVVNVEVIDRENFQRKWRRVTSQRSFHE